MDRRKRKPLILLSIIALEIAVIIFLNTQHRATADRLADDESLLDGCAEEFFQSFRADNVIADLVEFNSTPLKRLIAKAPLDVCLSLNVSKEGFGLFYHADMRYYERCIDPLVLCVRTLSEDIEHKGVRYTVTIELVRVRISGNATAEAGTPL